MATAAFGTRASTGWTSTCANCKRRKDRAMAESDPGAAPLDGAFTVARVFDAPRDVVWKAWTEAEHPERWWGPKGFTVRHCAVDLRPDGVLHYGLQAPGGTTMWGRWVFREIAAPERLVFVASFSDAQAGMTCHALAPAWAPRTP